MVAEKQASPEKVDLGELDSGHGPGISAPVGAFLGHAAAVTLEDHAHRSGVQMKVDGSYERDLSVEWPPPADSRRARRSFDPVEAVEFGACGIAALIARRVIGLDIAERAARLVNGRYLGFDYWLCEEGADPDDDQLFQNKGRLEVSGIGEGTDADLERRVRSKQRQTKRSDDTGLPSHAAVVEFGTPRCRVTTR